jgi:hypothetical protein
MGGFSAVSLVKLVLLGLREVMVRRVQQGSVVDFGAQLHQHQQQQEEEE